MRRRALLMAFLPLSGLAMAQVPGTGTAPPPLPPLPDIPLERGVTAPEPNTWLVEFPPGGEALEPPQRLALGRIGAALNTGSAGRITLIAEVGEGDDLSTARRLSLMRGLAVKEALVVGGLTGTRIDIRPMGRTTANRNVVNILAPTATRP